MLPSKNQCVKASINFHGCYFRTWQMKAMCFSRKGKKTIHCSDVICFLCKFVLIIYRKRCSRRQPCQKKTLTLASVGPYQTCHDRCKNEWADCACVKPSAFDSGFGSARCAAGGWAERWLMTKPSRRVALLSCMKLRLWGPERRIGSEEETEDTQPPSWQKPFNVASRQQWRGFWGRGGWSTVVSRTLGV